MARSTVDRLKSIIAGFAAECHTSISKYGKKNELIDRICDALASWKARSDLVSFQKARGIIYQVKNTGRCVAWPWLPRFLHASYLSLTFHSLLFPATTSFSGSTPMTFPSTSAGAAARPRYAAPYVPALPTARAALPTALPASSSAPAATTMRPGKHLACLILVLRV